MLFLVSVTLIHVGCDVSKKGKWSERDKQKFLKDVNAVEELSDFGENKSKWVECYLSKCEANYSSYFQANQDIKGCEKLALACNEEVFANGSVKGNWSESDKQKFRKTLNEVEELSDLGIDKPKWIECYLQKCEVNYASFYAADQDEKGCEMMASDCYDEVMSN